MYPHVCELLKHWFYDSSTSIYIVQDSKPFPFSQLVNYSLRASHTQQHWEKKQIKKNIYIYTHTQSCSNKYLRKKNYSVKPLLMWLYLTVSSTVVQWKAPMLTLPVKSKQSLNARARKCVIRSFLKLLVKCASWIEAVSKFGEWKPNCILNYFVSLPNSLAVKDLREWTGT